MRCDHAIEHPGGGGVNVARVLHRLGASCVAAYMAGGVTGERHHQWMLHEKVRCHLLPIANETRESFSVHENSSGQDFRFVLPGPEVSEAEVQACFAYVAQHLPKQFLLKNQAADNNGYLVATKSGLAQISTPIALPKAV